MKLGESSRRWIVLLAALATVALTARLGVWQLSRAAQKEGLQATLDERRALPALATAELARDASAAVAQHQRLIRIEGRWRSEHTVFLDNRQMDGRPGFFVLTPLEIAPGEQVLVQRGWAPRDPRVRDRLPAVPTSDGVVAFDARIAPPPARLYSFGATETGPLRQNIDLDAFGRERGLLLRPLSLVQLGAADDGLARDWPAPASGVHKHYGYAFQWFALAALVAVLYVWFQLIRPRRRPA